jgi:para-nitrobenzyl esterase
MTSGAHNHVDFIVGANSEETANSVPPLSEGAFLAIVQATFGFLGMATVQQILELYALDKYGGDPRAAYVALTTDVKFVCGARTTARAIKSGQDEPVYRYHFTYNDYTVGMNQSAYAFHGLELVYLFGNFDAVELGPFEYTPNASDLALVEVMQGAWTSFARDGDPADAGLSWPLYSVDTDPHVLLDIPPGQGLGARAEECDFWDSIF